MGVKLSPVGNDAPFMDSAGIPYVGAKLFHYVGGSVNTKQTTYTTSAGTVANSNPMILNAAGWPTTNGTQTMIWLTEGQNYKIFLAASTDTDPPTSPAIKEWDVISGINDNSASQSEWISGPAPTFVSATSFTLVGDQTSLFTAGRRVKTTNTGGTVYSTIITSAFAVVTTITVANDSSTLDSGLSAVSYGLIASVNPSISADEIYRKGTAVASAATTNIWGIVGDFVHITGNTGPITSFGTSPYAGDMRTVIFDSTPTITHNATTLQLPGGISIVAAAGDRAVVRADTTANMIVTSYFQAATGAYLNINGATDDTAPDLNADYVNTYDASATLIKKVLIGRIGAGTLGTLTATTSGTSVDFTGIPSWAKKIIVSMLNVSTNGTNPFRVQLGDSGGVEVAGYSGSRTGPVLLSAGFDVYASVAAGTFTGQFVLVLVDSATNTWTCVANVARSDVGESPQVSVGSKATSAALDRVRFTTVGSTDTFDAGSVNILYE